jgi:hypothetical protein
MMVIVLTASIPLLSTINFQLSTSLARREGLEPPTNGFGDRYSTN